MSEPSTATPAAWQSTLKQAVVGLERGASAAISEQQLLHDIAMLSVRKRAGQTLSKTQFNLPASATEVTEEHRGTILERLLDHEHQALFIAYLEHLASLKRRIPSEYLVVVLNTAREWRVREAVLPVLGERGHWLAMYNDNWQWASKLADKDHWHTGSKAERLQFLKNLRAKDPAKARDVIAQTWQEDSASERSSFITVLEQGLSLEDEAFLEQTLGERSKQVRSESGRLLAKLPGSRLCQRMTERTRTLVTFEAKALKPNRVHLQLVEGLSEDMLQDGIQEKPPHSKMGKQAWWTIQVLQATDLNWWQTHFQRTPEQIILAAHNNNEWRDLLIESLEIATIQFANPRWAQALLSYYFDKKLNLRLRHLDKLFPLAYEPEERDRILIKAMKQSAILYKDDNLKTLLLGHTSWSAKLTHRVMQAFAKEVTGLKHYTSHVQIYRSFALHMEPRTAQIELAAWSPQLETPDWFDRLCDDMRSTIELRCAIAKEFS